MYRNYFLFAEQARWLKTQILDGVIEACFTYRKSELVLLIENQFLKIGLNSSNPYILLTQSRNIKEAKVNFFAVVIGQKINNIEIHPFDKQISLSLQNYYFKIHFYGRQPNILLLDNENNEIAGFKKNDKLEVNNNLDIIIDPFNCTFTNLSGVISDDPTRTLEKLLVHHIGGFNLLLTRECSFRAKLKSDSVIQHLNESDIQRLTENIQQIANETLDPVYQIYFEDNIPKHISIIKLHCLQDFYSEKNYENVNDAWRNFLYMRFEAGKIKKELNQNKQVIEKRIKFINKSLLNINENEKLENRKKLAELKGNLLLTFISDIPRGSDFVKLKNIFSDKSEVIEIKLNPAKTVQENAKKYFEKFKDIETQKYRIENRKNILERELNELNILRVKNSSVKSLKNAQNIEDELIQRKLIQNNKSEATYKMDLKYSFKHILLENKWDIYIGKNDKNNDLLTFKFAHKFDLWFHAQGVPGSHVIIRLSQKEEIPPPYIIEQAAVIAAYNSNSRHSSTVPVIYTQVRYVRKQRKAKAGTVSVLQHKTIFVEPKNL